MLETIRRTIQEVNAAPDLDHALAIIVRRVRQAVAADACSVYLTEAESGDHVLRATDGLDPAAVNQVRLRPNEGLVNVVSKRAEPVSLDDAQRHPGYMYVAETGEKRFHAFMGVPIIQHRQVLGVLVVRQTERRLFDEAEVTLVVTLASQLAGAITHAALSAELEPLNGATPPVTRTIRGRPGAPGIAIGTAVVVYPSADLDAVPDRTVDDPVAEEATFRTVVARAQAEIGAMKERMDESLPSGDRALFNAYVLMLGSDSLMHRVVELIREGSWAAGALRQTIEEHARVFEEMEDAYLRERASDIRDIGRRILMHLQAGPPRERQFHPRTILVGEELTATSLAEVPTEYLAGVVSIKGSAASHVAILANALGIPAVMGATDLPTARMEGREVVVDGYRGHLHISPSLAVRAEFERLADEEAELSETLQQVNALLAESTDGVHIPLQINAGLLADISPSLDSGAEGVGLYRTEIPFMLRERFPGEDTQYNIYRQVLEAFVPRPVTIRTLDVGGDKVLPYFPITEENPFLGWRGIRVTLDHPEIFLTQLRAMLRASHRLENLQILLPMVTTVGELDEAIALLRRAYREMVEEGEEIVYPRVGVMIEVPSAVFQADVLAARVDFLSVGTNDLTQYLLAVDRNNAAVADLFDSLHPAVVQALVQVVEAGRRHGKPVSICGELAGDPLASVLLLGMGVHSLSMNSGRMPRVKMVIRKFSSQEARELLDAALQMEDSAGIRALLHDALEARGLGGLVRAGK